MTGDGTDRRMNPFVIPASKRRIRSLCPWKFPGDEEYYVAVNGHGQVFDEFVQLSDIPSLKTEGCFVVVTGDAGCGKTALLHRCVHRISRELSLHGGQSLIIDLTRDLDASPTLVCMRLLDELNHHPIFSASEAGALSRLTDEPARFYPYLSRSLDARRVLIILLPPTVQMEELAYYARLIRGGICFFAESLFVEQRLKHQSQTFVLQAGALNPGDIWRFISARLDLESSLSYPRISQETADRLEENIRSIGQLQSVLAAVYDERLRHFLTYTSKHLVTYEEILEFALKDIPPSPTITGRNSKVSEYPPADKSAATEPEPLVADGRRDSRWDFFVSYTQTDRAWAEWVAWQLEEAGYHVLIQAWDFVPGTNWQAGMQQGVARADRTIALISPAYLQSVFGQQEWQAAQSADPLGFARKLVPIRVADCDRPGLLASVVSFDLFHLDVATARKHLLKQIRILRAGRAKPVDSPDFPNDHGNARTDV